MKRVPIEAGIDTGTAPKLTFRRYKLAAAVFEAVLKEYGITSSMSRKGNCWDNACRETLFGSLKVERLHGQCLKTRREAKDEIIDWPLWYYRAQLHSTLTYVSPMQFGQTGLPINQGKPTHEISYGVRIPGARSQAMLFLRNAVAHYATMGVTVRRLLTDNGRACGVGLHIDLGNLHGKRRLHTSAASRPI